MKNNARPYFRFIAAALLVLGLTCPNNVQAQKIIDTFHFYFDLNVSKLNKNIERKVDLLIYNDKIINGSEIMVIGYADFLGSEKYNKNLSMERAKNLKQYLIKYGIDAASVKVCLGKGEIKSNDTTDKEGNPDDRKVDIVVNNKVRITEKWRKPLKQDFSGIARNNITTPPTDDKTNINNSKTAEITELNKLKAGQTLLLRNVYFPPGSHVIKSESFATLEKLFTTMVKNPQLKINIEGHVCCIHDVPDALDIDTNEPQLSVNRAHAIFNYLVEKGIDKDRLQYEGFGKRRPVVANEQSEQDAEKNRRVEIRITSN